MKIIHTADIHIGSAMKNLPNEKARQRRQEALIAFRYLADYAKQNGVTAVLICGDLFDENAVSLSVMQETLAIISSSPNTLFFYCQGNHDRLAKLTGELPQNLYLFGDAHGWKSYNVGENILITGIDGNYLNEGASIYARLHLPKEYYNVVIAHGDLTTAAGKDCVCLPMLQNKNIDYLALGHIHNPDRALKPMQARGGYRYSGALFSRGFDECGEKGFFEIEIKGGRIVAENFIVIPTVRAVNAYIVDVSECQTPEQLFSKIEQTLQFQRAQDVVKLVVTGRATSMVKKNFYRLETQLSQRYFYFKLEDKTTLALDYGEAFLSSPILREVARILDEQPQLAQRKDELLDLAVKAFAGEDLEL